MKKDERRTSGSDKMNRQPGPKPGSLKAIPQHEAIAIGYKSPETARRTKTFQKETETGGTYAPGFTTNRSGRA